MENEQILGGLCQDNGIIQIENERGQFSHILLSPFFSLSFYLGLFFFLLCVMHTNTHSTAFNNLHYYLLICFVNRIAMWNRICI